MEDGEPRVVTSLMEKPKALTASGEVDYRMKSGTAWSHNFLNQKPWHPLSYPNQRRKWIAEQTDAQRSRRADEVAKEFAQEQEFFKQNAMISKKEKEKIEIMKAVSFMYVRPPGYNPESAKAAELEDEKRKEEERNPPQHKAAPSEIVPDSNMPIEEVKKKARPKDVFGRALPTEEEFEVLKNAPRLETGLPARPKPFGIEIRNVKCLRCGTFGHQSGDRECPLKDTVMPNEESRLKRDDPLTIILAQAESCEPLKWELKQKPGLSPPRGGFKPDDPNQQIVAEDIFDEYGGFLDDTIIPDLLTNFYEKKSRMHSKSKSKHKRRSNATDKSTKAGCKNTSCSPASSDADKSRSHRKKKIKQIHKRRKQHCSYSSSPDNSYLEKNDKREKSRKFDSVSCHDPDLNRIRKRNKKEFSASSSDVSGRHGRERRRHLDPISPDHHKEDRRRRSDMLSPDRHKKNRKPSISPDRHKRNRRLQSDSASPDGRKRTRLPSDPILTDHYKRSGRARSRECRKRVRTRQFDSDFPDRYVPNKRGPSLSVSPDPYKTN